MSVYKRSGSPYYQTEFVLSDGTRIRRSTRKKTHREALAEQKRIRQEEEERLARKPIGGFLTLSQGFGQYWEEKADEFAQTWAKEVARYAKQIIEAVGGDTLLADISDSHVNQFVQARRRSGGGHYAINRAIAVWQTMHNRAAKVWKQPVQMINWTQFKGKEKKRTEALSIEQVEYLLPFLTERVALATEWTLYTGCRWSETYNLTHDDVDLSQFHAIVTAKGGKRHTVWLSDQAIDVVQRAPIKGRYVFDRTNWRREWERGLRKAGLDGFTWHGLRHTHATWLRQAGVPVEVVQQSLGHEQIATTMRYAHVDGREVRDALQRLPTIGSEKSNIVRLIPAKSRGQNG